MRKKERGAKRREIEKEAALDSLSLSVCGAELHLDFSETKEMVAGYCYYLQRRKLPYRDVDLPVSLASVVDCASIITTLFHSKGYFVTDRSQQ